MSKNLNLIMSTFKTLKGFLMNTNNEIVIPKKSDYIDTSDKSRINLEESNSLQVLVDSNSNA